VNRHPLYQLTLARFREFYREPAAVFWVYGFPLLLAVALGIAFRDRPVEKIIVDVVTDGAGGLPAAQAIAAKLGAEERLKVNLNPDATAKNRLRTAKTGLVIRPVAADSALSAKWEYQLDPNRPECVLARNSADNVLLRSDGSQLPKPQDVTTEEPGGRYIDFLLPGLIGTNLMGGGLFGVGFVIVDLRVRKLLKRFLATPMKKHHFMLSLLISRLVFVLVEIAVLLTFAYFAFGVTVHGSWPALFALIFASGLSFGGLGLLIACRAKTIETVSGLMNAIMLPMYVVSGVFFPSDRFPDAVQPLIQLLPLTACIDGLRAIINDGSGFAEVWQSFVVLGAWGMGSFALALRLFRWR
jgi:ABC-2 type transport system permease protein